MLRRVLLLTLTIELAGFVVLLMRNLFAFPLPTAAWHALFHSVSAYCNAGFSLFDDSFVSYQGDWTVNLTLAALIIVGGIGYPVILDVGRTTRLGWPRAWDALHLHSKMMLIGTASLLLIGTLTFLILEFDGPIRITRCEPARSCWSSDAIAT